MGQQTRSSIELDYKGLTLLLLGVTYTPAEPATPISPWMPDRAEWDVMCLKSDPGKHNLTDFFSYIHCDNVEDLVCERFRG